MLDAKRALEREGSCPTFPEGAVLADPTKQDPYYSYAGPVLFYVDKPFECVDCGKEEVWTAGQQKWYHEVAKGSLYATAVRCRGCRRKRANSHNGQGDPNPIKHQGTLIKRVQASIAPAMAKAGFLLVSRTMLHTKHSAALDYSRHDIELTCRYDFRNGAMVAESLDQLANCSVIAHVSMSTMRSTSQILDLIQEFSDAVTHFVADLPTYEDKAEVEEM